MMREQHLGRRWAGGADRDSRRDHWLEHRLPLEPEWQEHRADAVDSLRRLLDLWRVESTRVGLYGDEAGLEEKFIQPVFESLGWHLKYQTYLNRREPDYALFPLIPGHSLRKHGPNRRETYRNP